MNYKNFAYYYKTVQGLNSKRLVKYNMSIKNTDMHIFLVLDSSNFKGGVGIYVKKLHEELLRMGVSNSIVTCKNGINKKNTGLPSVVTARSKPGSGWGLSEKFV